jgi:hypothetical protein
MSRVNVELFSPGGQILCSVGLGKARKLVAEGEARWIDTIDRKRCLRKVAEIHRRNSALSHHDCLANVGIGSPEEVLAARRSLNARFPREVTS